MTGITYMNIMHTVSKHGKSGQMGGDPKQTCGAELQNGSEASPQSAGRRAHATAMRGGSKRSQIFKSQATANMGKPAGSGAARHKKDIRQWADIKGARRLVEDLQRQMHRMNNAMERKPLASSSAGLACYVRGTMAARRRPGRGLARAVSRHCAQQSCLGMRMCSETRSGHARW